MLSMWEPCAPRRVSVLRLSYLDADMSKSKSRPKVANPKKLLSPARGYMDDEEIAEIALRKDPIALAHAKAYLARRRNKNPGVDRDRGHWIDPNARGSIDDAEKARQAVGRWLMDLLESADGTEKIRKSVAAAMIGMSQPHYDAELRRIKGRNAGSDESERIPLPVRPPLATPKKDQSARHARAYVYLEEVRAVRNFLEKEKRDKVASRLDQALPPAIAAPRQRRLSPDPVESAAAIPVLNHPLVIEARAERGLIAGTLKAGRYYIVEITEDRRMVQTEVLITALPEQEIVGFLTSGCDLECLTIHEALTRREWAIEGEMKRWVDCFTVLARRAQDANVSLLEAAEQVASEDAVEAVEWLRGEIAIENEHLTTQIADVNAAHLRHLLPTGPDVRRPPF